MPWSLPTKEVDVGPSRPQFLPSDLAAIPVALLTAETSTGCCLPASQSIYGHYHSTETAAVIVYNDIVRAIDRGSAPLVLDLNSAFDTIDHNNAWCLSSGTASWLLALR